MRIYKVTLWIIVVTVLCGSLGNSGFASSNLSTYLYDLESSNWMIKRDAIIALGKIGAAAEETIPVLEELLYDDLWAIRDSTARTLGKMGASAVPALTKALGHEDIQTQLGVIRALENIGAEAVDSITKLTQLLNGDNPSRDQAIIKALGAMGEAAEEAVGEIALYLGHPDTMVRFTAMQSIKKITTDSLVTSLVELILNPEKSIKQRMAGIRVFENINDDRETIINGLTAALKTDEKLVRWVGATMLGNIGSRITFDASNAIESLLELLDDGTWFVRSAALTALRKLNSQVDEKDFAILSDALTAGSNLQRLVSADLLAKIDNETTITALKQQLEKEHNDDVIIAIVRGLRTQGISDFDFVKRTDIVTLINSVRTEPAVVNLISMLDNEAQTILEAQNMTKEEYIAYKAWENNTTVEEMATLYKEYQYEVNATNRMYGAFKNSIDIRSQEGTYTLAYLYQEPLSRYYQNQHVLNSVLRSLDYMTRAQGSNGGFVDGGREWPGVPNRSHAYDPVAGFTLYSMSRSMIILHEQPAFQAALNELIDVDGLGRPHISRRDGWIKMLANAAKWITFEQRGHGPNQDIADVVSAYTLNEAHKLLHTDNLEAITTAELDKLTKQCLSSTTWWTDQGMLKERNGPDPAGYDGHYGSVTQYWLGLLTMYHPSAITRMEKYLNVLQYFYYPVSTGAYQIEGVTANRRRMEKGADIVALSMSHNYHQAMKPIYYATFETLKVSPRLDFPGGSHTFSESLYKYVDFMEYGQIPQPSGYAIPAESPGPWLYLDPAARALVAKTEDGKLVYVSLAAKRYDEPAPYHIVGKKQGTFYLNPERLLDQQVISSTQPYAYDIQFSPIEELEDDAWNLIYELLESER